MLALALVRPVAETVIVPAPVVTGVNVEVATPFTALTVAPGLNDPVTPLTANVIAAVDPTTVLPLASCTVAV